MSLTLNGSTAVQTQLVPSSFLQPSWCPVIQMMVPLYPWYSFTLDEYSGIAGLAERKGIIGLMETGQEIHIDAIHEHILNMAAR